jgi:hypothetical protein
MPDERRIHKLIFRWKTGEISDKVAASPKRFPLVEKVALSPRKLYPSAKVPLFEKLDPFPKN